MGFAFRHSKTENRSGELMTPVHLNRMLRIMINPVTVQFRISFISLAISRIKGLIREGPSFLLIDEPKLVPCRKPVREKKG
jgi:hypothetical protein